MKISVDFPQTWGKFNCIVSEIATEIWEWSSDFLILEHCLSGSNRIVGMRQTKSGDCYFTSLKPRFLSSKQFR